MLTDIIRKHALKNRKDFGSTNSKSIIGKVIADFPDAKKDMKVTIGEGLPHLRRSECIFRC